MTVCPVCGQGTTTWFGPDDDNVRLVSHLACAQQAGKTMRVAVEVNGRLEAENERLRGNLRSISEMGHNDDCLFCTRKDFNAQEWAARDDAS